MKPFEIGIVTDEISRNLEEALQLCAEWDVHHVELREGGKARFPYFTAQELSRVDSLIASGDQVTAVSPGIYKGHIEDTSRWQNEANDTFPRALELAQRFKCDTVIAFGFEECDNRRENRLQILKAFERIAEQAAEAHVTVALENEPDFWIDRPESTIKLLEEINHPSLKLNWDAANLHWGGQEPDEAAVDLLKDYIVNLHIKDFSPDDPEQPWRPLGEGIVPWVTLLPVLLASVDVPHLTIETHCEPLIENSRKSLEFLVDLKGK